MRKEIGFIALMLVGSFLLFDVSYAQERGKGKLPVPAERLRVVGRSRLMELPGGKYRFLGTKVFPQGVLTIEGVRGERQKLHLISRNGEKGLVGEGIGIHSPQFSPDGKKVAYGSLENGQYQVCVVDLETDEKVHIRHGAEARDVSFSPGMGKVVYCVHVGPGRKAATDFEIVVSTAGGRGARAIAKGCWPKWSPVGDKIAFTRAEAHSTRDRWVSYLWIISPDGKGERKLASSSELGGGNIAWSPDGRKIADAPGLTPEVSINIIDVETDQRIDIPQPSPTAESRRPVWSPGGDKLAFEAVFFKVGWITGKDATGKETRKYITIGDGVVENRDIFVVNSDGSGLRNLTNTPDTEEEDPVWMSEDELAVKVRKGRLVEVVILQVGQE